MATKKNKSKQSGQLARLSQNNSNSKNNAPVASAKQARSMAPKIQSSAKMTRIVHRELVSTINGNTTFGVSSFALNPGLSSSFPWLSSIAGSYEQYRFNRLTFHYVTRAPTTYIGSILMAPEYYPLDAAPSSEILASQMNGAIEDSPWKDQTITFSCADMFPMGPRKYMRTGTLPTSSDLKTYDAGQLFVCAVTCADTSAIGKLWVEYDVELHIPQNPGAAAQYNVGSAALYALDSAQTGLTSGAATAVIWATEALNDIGAVQSSSTITLLAGTYLVSGVIGFRGQSCSAGAFAADVQVFQDTVQDTAYVFRDERSDAGASSDIISTVPFNFLFTVTGSSSDLVIKGICTNTSGTLSFVANNSTISILRVA
jgi:hypothetical protein